MGSRKRLNRIVEDIENVIEEEINFVFVDTDDWVAKCKDYQVKISKGCVKLLNDNELAFVVSHEFAHYKLKHEDEINELVDECSEKASEGINEIWDSKGGFFKKFFASVLVSAASGVGSNIQIKSLSRDHEYVADKMALEIMEQAGYNTNGARSFLQRFGDVDEGFIKGLFSSHPPGSYRLGNVR